MPEISDILQQTSHRPWPVPEAPWIMTQTWQKLLFAHYALTPASMAPCIPAGLELDTFDGQAWLSIVPFKMGFRLRYSPYNHKFDELNVRTYVIRDGKPGVFFFSLDASDLFTVLSARLTFSLPYYPASMKLTQVQKQITFSSQRWGSEAGQHRFEASYQPVSPVYHEAPNTLGAWLTERYCLYSVTPKGALYRGEVHHLPWPLQQAEADIVTNTLLDSRHLSLGESADCLHYTEHLDIIIWAPQRLH